MNVQALKTERATALATTPAPIVALSPKSAPRADKYAKAANEVAVEGSCCIDTLRTTLSSRLETATRLIHRRERADKIYGSHTSRSILKADVRDAEARNAVNVADASTSKLALSGDDSSHLVNGHVVDDARRQCARRIPCAYGKLVSSRGSASLRS